MERVFLTGTIHGFFVTAVEECDQQSINFCEKLTSKVYQAALSVLSPIIYGTCGVAELVDSITEVSERHSPSTILKVALVFIKTMLVGTIRAVVSLFDSDRLRKQVDFSLTRSLTELDMARLGGIQYFLEEHALYSLQRLPDQGNRLLRQEDALLDFMAARSSSYFDLFFNQSTGDIVQNFIEQNYRADELPGRVQPQAMYERHVSVPRVQAFDIICVALREAKQALLQAGFYDEDSITSMEPESYQAMMNRAVYEILRNTVVTTSGKLLMSLENPDHAEPIVFELSQYSDWTESYEAMRRTTAAFQNFDAIKHDQLRSLLAFKDCTASDDVRELFNLITEIRVKWDRTIMNQNDMPPEHAERFMEIFLSSV